MIRQTTPPPGPRRPAWRLRALRGVLPAILLGLASCAAGDFDASGNPVRGTAPGASPGAGPTRWHVVAVAADASLPVWDNAAERFARSMPAAASVRRFSAAPRPGVAPATIPAVLQTIADLRPAPGEGCLVFMTAHGAPGRGLAFVLSNNTLGPAALRAALSRGCGDAPTVVIASGCFTGHFAPALAGPNRAVLTAARADRPSFGCGAGYTYTVFDSCLLDALDATAARGWSAVAERAAACVSAEEARLREQPSEPQRSVAPALAREPIAWQPSATAGPAPPPRRPSAAVKG